MGPKHRAQELLAHLPVNLVIAEYPVPESDGQFLIEALRSHRPNVKLVLTIEHGTPDAVLEALRVHVCDFLISPFTPEELRHAVHSAISECPAQEIDVLSAQPDAIEAGAEYLSVVSDSCFTAVLSLCAIGTIAREPAQSVATLSNRQIERPQTARILT